MIIFTEAEFKRLKTETESTVHNVVSRSHGVKASRRSDILNSSVKTYENKIDREIIDKAQYRTFKRMSDQEIAFDAYSILMNNAYKEIKAKEDGIDLGKLDTVSMYVSEHFFELESRGRHDLKMWVQYQIERYGNNEITLDECQAFKEYEIFIID